MSRRRKGPPATRPLPSPPVARHEPLLAVCAGLVVIVFALYGQVARHQFVDLDDSDYVYNNRLVSPGLSSAGVRFAFLGSHSGLWHPLTTLSHMLDCQVFGLRAEGYHLGPAGHHLENVLLHALNAVLLLVAWRRMTGDFWPSVAVAAMFAVHPMHVESVAWASERKDVLSGLFWMLTILAYASYASAPSARRYLLVMASFVLALLSKPIVVTLPVVLLLLDIWPLRRWRTKQANANVGAKESRFPARSAGWLLFEKGPLLVLAGGAAAANIVTQMQVKALVSVGDLPLAARAANGLVSYAAYLGKLIWPFRLACFYPHPLIASPEGMSRIVAPAIRGGLLLSALTIAAVALGRRRPYVAVGWFWFLVTLLPVIGLLQAAAAAMADRYAYLSFIGLYVLLAWGVRDLVAGRPLARPLAVAAAGVVLAGWAIVSWFQIGVWHDTRSLFEHALAVTDNNYLAHKVLGNLDFSDNSPASQARAAAHFEAMLAFDNDNADAHGKLGMIYLRQGRIDRAESEMKQVLQLAPDSAPAHYVLGLVFSGTNRPDQAMAEFKEVLRINPNEAKAHQNLGALLANRGQLVEAVWQFKEALRIEPNYAEAGENLRRVEEALQRQKSKKRGAGP